MLLLLMRHAHADSAPDMSDHDRPLSQRGEADAATIGRWLRDRAEPVPIDLVLCSSAARARRTWALVAAQLATQPAVVHLREIYAAGPDDVRSALAGTPADARCVAVVGHNPTVTMLGRRLTDGKANHFPAGAMAIIEVEGSWSDPGASRLLELVTPESARGGEA